MDNAYGLLDVRDIIRDANLGGETKSLPASRIFEYGVVVRHLLCHVLSRSTVIE